MGALTLILLVLHLRWNCRWSGWPNNESARCDKDSTLDLGNKAIKLTTAQDVGE